MRNWVAACLVAVAMFTAGVEAFAQTKDVDIPYQRFVLDNGLTLIVHEDHKAPIVAINTWYHVGSKNEKPGKTGFAHLFEHLMFGGSEHAPGRYIDGMERIGATDLNGTTNNDRTNYFENVPTSAVDYTLWMESDRMGFLLGALDQKTLDLQRGVVQNEKRQGENQPYGVTRQLITQNTYPAGHPYSWTVIGEMADLNAAAMDDVKEWYKELARFLKEGPTAEELQRVKTQHAASFIRGIERIGGFGGKSDRLAQSEVFRGSPDAYKISLKRVQNATAEDLKAAANRWLSDGVYALEVHPFPQYKTASAGADRSKAPGTGTPPELKLPKLQRATLSNGLKVILAERHEVPLVDFWLNVDAG